MVIPLQIPSLRERRDDIPLLVGHFIERFNRELGKQVPMPGAEVLDLLMRYDWPGNVRSSRT